MGGVGKGVGLGKENTSRGGEKKMAGKGEEKKVKERRG